MVCCQTQIIGLSKSNELIFAMPYILYPCTNSEELFQAVLRNGQLSGLQLDFAHSRFEPQPRLLFQNNALGEWFKVRLAQEKGICMGLTIGHSKQILEHYLALFFPKLQINWGHADLVSLQVFHLLKNNEERNKYLPKVLEVLIQQLSKQKKAKRLSQIGYQDHFDNALEQHLWKFSQQVAQLFLSYDHYRRELQEALNPNVGYGPNEQLDKAFHDGMAVKAETWQQNLWHKIQQYQGLHWHGQLIEKVLAEKLNPFGNGKQDIDYQATIEPLYIIGSGFISAQQLTFYSYLSQFTDVYQYWLTPTEFPSELCNQTAQMFWGQRAYDAQQLSQAMGNLPKSLWLENSLHSAALLHHIPRITWQSYPQQKSNPPKSLLELVQHKLRYCTIIEPEMQSSYSPNKPIAIDNSIRYFACSNRRREVEVLKDQILASLDANPDWQLNDIAVLAPDINDYQILIQSVFQKNGVLLNYNFIDLNSSNGLLSPYFSAFNMLLGFKHFTMLDEWLNFLENPCVRANEFLQAKPQHFWLKVLRYWQFNLSGEHGVDRGIWQKARERLLHDYLWDYGGHQLSFGLNQQLSFDQSEAVLLGEVLGVIFELEQSLQRLHNGNRSISEWVRLLEDLQDKFLCCHNQSHRSDRDILNKSLRNFLAIEESLRKGQPNQSGKLEKSGKTSEAMPLRFPFSVMQNLLQDKLEQSFSFKGYYLTQGITCASLQPYRSVPFRMICVLGLDEKSFPRSSMPLRFDLCSSLPQHVSRQAQEQHMFAELLISARERLLLFYPNSDTVKGNEKSPSASLYELCYFIAQILGQEQEIVWQQLLQVQPLFPFDRCYFHSAEYFSYNSSHYREFLALQRSYQPSPLAEIGHKLPFLEVKGLANSEHSRTEEPLFTCDLQEVIAVISDAPAYFWQSYSGLKPWYDQDELPLLEQLSPSASNAYGKAKSLGARLSCASLEPLKYAKWQQQLWRDPEYLLAIFQLSEPDLRSFLEREGALGNQLFSEQQWQSLKQGRNVLKKQLESVESWPSWETVCRIRQYSISLQIDLNLASVGSERTLRSERIAKAGDTISRYGAFLLPALAVEFGQDGAFVLLEAHIPRLWLTGQRIICWNQSPFGLPPQLYSLLHYQLFVYLRQNPLFSGYTELLQLEWLYSGELYTNQQNFCTAQTMPTLKDYIWLVAQARCGALPLSMEFLNSISKKGKLKVQLSRFQETYQEACQSGDTPAMPENTKAIEPLVEGLQLELYQQWHAYLQTIIQPPSTNTNEALTHLAIDFGSRPLQQPRFWLLLHELLCHI